MTTDKWRWKNFKKEELDCRHCSAHIIVPEFLDRLQRLRDDYGRQMKITSGYRCSQYNLQISSTGLTGPHTTGRAVDICVAKKDAYDLLHLALLHGFTGIGIKQTGPYDKRFIHLDDISDRTIRPTVWTYP